MIHDVNCGFPEDGGTPCLECRNFFGKVKASGRCGRCNQPIDRHQLNEGGEIVKCPNGGRLI